MRCDCARPATAASLRLRGAADRGGGDGALPFLPRARPGGGEMASLIPAATSSPAGAPSRSKKRPASPGTGSGPAKKKKVAASSGSQVMLAGGQRACAAALATLLHLPRMRACGAPWGRALLPAGTVRAQDRAPSCCVCSFVALGPRPFCAYRLCCWLCNYEAKRCVGLGEAVFKIASPLA